MASYFGITSDSVSTLFSSISSTAGNAAGSILADYAAIKNGSYYKLAKAYYSKQNSVDTEDKSSTTSTASDTAKELTRAKNNADNLKESTAALLEKGTDSVFAKERVKGEDGTETYGYNVNEILKAVKNYVEDYNAVVESTDDLNATSVTRPASGIVNYTEMNEKALAKIGITIGEDNTLSVDEETFKKADMEDVKELFNGTGSYAYLVQSKAFSISMAATSEQSKSATYTSSGTYSYNYSSSFENFI